MSSRIVAFRLDSGQLRFAMMSNLNCYPTRLKSWSLATASDGQNVTLARGGSALLPYRKPTPSGEPVRLIRPETADACMTHETQKRPRLSYLRFANNDSKISSLQYVVWVSSSVQVRYFLSYFNHSSFQSYPKIYFSFTRSLFVSQIACISVPVSSFWRKFVDNDVLKSSQTRGGFSSEEEK